MSLSRNGSEGEARRLHEKLEEIAHKRARAQDLALDDLLTREELRAKLHELDEAKVAIEEELDRLAPEERHRVYKMLRLRVDVEGGGRTEIRGALTGGATVCKNGGRGS